MKKVAVIATALLGVFVIGAYFLLSNRPDSHPAVGSDSANEDASAQERQLSDDMSSAVAHAPSAKTEEMGRAVEEAITRIAPERYRHEVIGDKTDFRFFGGEIGYVDVESIVQRRDPYSVIELLRNHHVLTGADESLELQIESTVDTHRGIIADFFQVIGGVPTEARGSVGFDSSGAVYVVTAVLYKSNAADAGAIKILQAEAEAIALEAVRRFSEPRRAPFEERGWPLLMETNPGELRYALAADAGNELRAEWRVGVMTANPRDSLEVLVDGATGDVVGITRTVVPLAAQSQCTELTFRVCDGLLAQPPDSGPMTPRQSCDRTTSNQVVPIFDGNECVADDETLCKRSEYTKPREEAYAARDYVKARGTEYLQGVGGADCRIDILVNTETETEGAAGEYDEEEDVIRISNQPNPETVAHEVFHAVSKGSGDIEHGLVYSMDAIYKEAEI